LGIGVWQRGRGVVVGLRRSGRGKDGRWVCSDSWEREGSTGKTALGLRKQVKERMWGGRVQA